MSNNIQRMFEDVFKSMLYKTKELFLTLYRLVILIAIITCVLAILTTGFFVAMVFPIPFVFGMFIFMAFNLRE